jgi:hypothetical protein
MLSPFISISLVFIAAINQRRNNLPDLLGRAPCRAIRPKHATGDAVRVGFGQILRVQQRLHFCEQRLALGYRRGFTFPAPIRDTKSATLHALHNLGKLALIELQ